MAKSIRDPAARARVVEAAWKVVADHGRDGATFRAIAAEAGVSTGYVTHYFEDKDVLLQAVLRHNNEQAGARVLGAAATARGLSALRLAVDAILPLDRQRRREWQVWGAFWSAAPSDAMAREGITAARQAMRDGLTAVLHQAVEDGELAEDLDLGYEGDRLLAVIAGVGLLSGLEPPVRVRALAERAIADHLDHLTGRKPWLATSTSAR
ncbi:MAG: TetR/AcrR family transcriptional regulator [Acidimicrobiales bacterium]